MGRNLNHALWVELEAKYGGVSRVHLHHTHLRYLCVRFEIRLYDGNLLVIYSLRFIDFHCFKLV